MKSALEEFAIPAALVGLVGFTFLTGGSQSASDLVNTGAKVKELRQQQAVEGLLLSTRQEAQQNRAEVAKQRYSNGCTIYVIQAPVQRPQSFANGATDVMPGSVKEGNMLINWQGLAYSRGQVICDTEGNTGVIDDKGMVADAAYDGSVETQEKARRLYEDWLSRNGGK